MNNRDALKLAYYVYNNYPEFSKKFEFWQILSLIDRNKEKIIYIRENNLFAGCAMYLTLTEESFQFIKSDGTSLTDPNFMGKFIEEDGDNIHFIYVLAKGYKIIRKGIDKLLLLRSPKTISWYNPKMNKFHYYKVKRSKLCHQ